MPSNNRKVSSSSQQQSTSSEVATTNSVRERLLQAAMTIVLTEGISTLTQTRVAKIAGVRQSHLTYYFPTRSALLAELAQYIIESSIAHMHRASGLQPATLEQLEELLWLPLDNNYLIRIMLALTVASDEDPDLKQWLIQFEERFQCQLQSDLAALGWYPSKDELMLFHMTLAGLSIWDLPLEPECATNEKKRLLKLAFNRLIATTPLRPNASIANHNITI